MLLLKNHKDIIEFRDTGDHLSSMEHRISGRIMKLAQEYLHKFPPDVRNADPSIVQIAFINHFFNFREGYKLLRGQSTGVQRLDLENVIKNEEGNALEESFLTERSLGGY